MFIGEYHHAIDKKNRLTIPSPFRQQLNRDKNELIITMGLDKSLFLYSFSEWKNLEQRLKNLSTTQSNTRAFLRIFSSGAHLVQLDNQGRIVLPQSLKDFAGIKEKVAIIGAFNKIEIWDEKEWDKYYQSKQEIFEELSEKIIDLGI